MAEEYANLALKAEMQGKELSKFVGMSKFDQIYRDWRGYGNQFGHGFISSVIHSIGKINFSPNLLFLS